MGTLANSEDSDEMPHNAAFHQGLHYLQDKIDFQERDAISFRIITCDPSIYTMDHPDLRPFLRPHMGVISNPKLAFFSQFHVFQHLFSQF